MPYMLVLTPLRAIVGSVNGIRKKNLPRTRNAIKKKERKIIDIIPKYPCMYTNMNGFISDRIACETGVLDPHSPLLLFSNCKVY